MDNSDIKPTTIMLIAGGVVLFVSTLLDWASFSSGGFSGWDTDLFGLLGIVCAIIGAAIGGGMAARQFANVSMPDQLLGFSHDQVHLVLGGYALLTTLGFVFRGDVGIGLWIAILASGTIVAAAVMDLKDGDSAAATPPTQF